jgi:hypothetical protein
VLGCGRLWRAARQHIGRIAGLGVLRRNAKIGIHGSLLRLRQCLGGLAFGFLHFGSGLGLCGLKLTLQFVRLITEAVGVETMPLGLVVDGFKLALQRSKLRLQLRDARRRGWIVRHHCSLVLAASHRVAGLNAPGQRCAGPLHPTPRACP